MDRPWSQYFCCMLAAIPNSCAISGRDQARLRAILKADRSLRDRAAAAARQLVDGGFTPRYDYALQTLKEVPYDIWREYDPEDSMRFYALRMHEAGLIKSTPQKIIAEGTDWRFLDEIKRELKG